MDFLVSMKVLHGDLAARNILLCENNIVKISDFGLSRSLYQSGYYKKECKTVLIIPYKWVAIESIRNHKFSIHYDVWSFGELFKYFFMTISDFFLEKVFCFGSCLLLALNLILGWMWTKFFLTNWRKNTIGWASLSLRTALCQSVGRRNRRLDPLSSHRETSLAPF